MNAGSSWIPAGQDTGLRAVTLLVWSPGHKGMLVVTWSTSHLDTGFWHVHCLSVFSQLPVMSRISRALREASRTFCGLERQQRLVLSSTSGNQ